MVAPRGGARFGSTYTKWLLPGEKVFREEDGVTPGDEKRQEKDLAQTSVP